MFAGKEVTEVPSSFVEMAEGHGKGQSQGSILVARVGTSASVQLWNELFCCLEGCAVGHKSV